MAVTSWMLRERTFRSGRTFSRHKSESEEDTVDLDANKDANENAFEILSNICKKKGLSDGKKLGYLNVFTKLIEKMGNSNEEFIMSREDMLCCLKVGIVSTNTLVRAGGLRVIRYFISSSDDVILLNKLQIPSLIARSIDLVLRNDHERIQAFRLALKILNLCPRYFSAAITRSLVSLANSISENKNRMSNSCLAILCQLCVLNPDLLLTCNGQTAILRSTLEISQARINECLVGCLLYLMNKPETRTKANIQFEYLTSIYCDWQRKRTKKELNNIYTSSMLSILAALRTWTGVFYLCQPNNVSGIKAIVDVLYLNQFEVRKAILELLYEIFGLDHEDWTDEILIAIKNIDPSKYRDLWSLNEKFVAAEGKDLLPHRAHSRTNLTEVHTALIVYCLIECGLLAALVEVIVTTDAILSVQAVTLLGFVLHLSHKLLPPEVIELSPRLPSLVHYAANGLPKEKTQALMAVSTLCRIHELFKSRPAPFSLFLHQLLHLSNWYKKMEIQSAPKNSSKSSKISKKKGFTIQIKNIDDHIKESQVLTSKDPKHWSWDHIVAILHCQTDSFIKLEDSRHRNFIKKLMNFYKPSANEYCTIKYNSKIQDNNIYTTTSFALWNFLLQTDDGEPKKILIEFLVDLNLKLREVVSRPNIHEILFSPQNLHTTMCQHYFLMIGYLLSTENGESLLEKHSILDALNDIVANSKHDFYTKLILSSLNYNTSSKSRDILSKALSSLTDSVRMYATELLLVLARSDVNNFSTWGLDLLVGQMYDENKVIATTSINILHELSYDQEYLESLINIRPSLLHLGDKGRLLLIRFLSTTNGFVFLSDANFVQNELENWEKEYNVRYVGLMEGDLHDCLTLYQRTEDGKYSRRYSSSKHPWRQGWKDVFVYPHLYGELAQHEKGFQALVQNGFIFKMIQVIHNGNCNSDFEIMELKSSLWGISSMATSNLGLKLLEQENIISKIVNIAQNSSVLTVRATAFYCICLISTTINGANALSKYGWYSVRHNRYEKWPIVQTEYLLMNEVNDLKSQEDLESTSSATYDSDDPDWTMADNPKWCNEIRDPVLKARKASTLPRGIVPTCEDNQKRHVVDTQNLREGEDFIRSPGIPIIRGNHQRSYSESFHRKKRLSSDTSCDGSEVCQKLSFQDAVGLATLQSLHNYRRPDVTSTINSELEESEFRKSFSSQDRMSNSPTSDFEAHYPPKLFSNTSSSSLCSLAQKTSRLNKKSDSSVSNFSYRGICLPKTLSEFLCPNVLYDVNSDKKEERRGLRKRGSHSFSEMEQVKELAEAENEDLTATSSSDDSEWADLKEAEKKEKKEYEKLPHNPITCIACCLKACKERKQRKISGESIRLRTDTESSGNPNENSPTQMKSRLRTQSENFTCDSADSLSNTDLKKEMGTDGLQVMETELDDSSSSVHTPRTEKISLTKVKRDVLKHINRMCNPVWAKASEQSLLHYKQSHPSVFEDACLYSSACDILSNSACRVTARRFIQELFLDVSFSKVFDDAADILEKYTTSLVPNLASIGDSLSSESSLHLVTVKERNSQPSERGDVEVEVTMPKTTMPKSKCTSPTNLTTLFENIASPHEKTSTISVTSGHSQNDSSSQIRFSCQSSEKVVNS